MNIFKLLLVHYASTHSDQFNPAPASIDTQYQGTSLIQLWMEDGLSSDICGGVEIVLVTPQLPLLLCESWHYCLCLFDIAALCSSTGKDNRHCICSHNDKFFPQAAVANISPPSLIYPVTPVTAGERGLALS